MLQLISIALALVWTFSELLYAQSGLFHLVLAVAASLFLYDLYAKRKTDKRS